VSVVPTASARSAERCSRAVRHRIRERHAELDQVGAASARGAQELARAVEVGIAGHDERDEPGASLGAQTRERVGDPAHAVLPSPSRGADAEILGDGLHVLVAAAGEVHEHDARARQRRRERIAARSRASSRAPR
jgi:hypothetical protein